MGSGLIYAAIIVMWALYFIPRWLRRHEELSESRSVEKFDRAMRILSRREPTPDQRSVVMPRRPAEDTEPISSTRSRPARPSVPARSGAARPGAARAAEARRVRSQAARRRRVLAGFVLTTVLVAIATPFTPVPWFVPVLLLMLTIGDLVHLRAQQRRRVDLRRTRHAVRRRTRSRLQRFDSAERIVEARKALAAERAAADAERREAQRAAEEAARLEEERLTAEAMGWEPTPFPLPTYVTKPMAPRVGRPIDLTVPGRWSATQTAVGAVGGGAGGHAEEPFDQTLPSGHPPVPPQTTSATAASYEDYAEELDAILERRAVND